MADVVNVVKARSMLMILRASCEQALVTLEAAEIDSSLADDLDKMIKRIDTELAALTQELDK